VSFVSLVRRGADPDAHIVLAKAAPAMPAKGAKKDDMEEKAKKRLPPWMMKKSEAGSPAPTAPKGAMMSNTAELPVSVAKALEGVTLTDEQRSALIESVTALAAAPSKQEPVAPAGDEGEGEVTKGAVDITKSAEYQAIAKRAEDAEKLAKELREESDIAKSVATVRAEFPNLPVDAAALGAAMYRVEKGGATAEDLELIRTGMRAANGIAKHGAAIMREQGTMTPAENSPEGRIEKLAKGIAADNAKLTPEQAYMAALNTDEGKAAYGEAERVRAERLAGIAAD